MEKRMNKKMDFNRDFIEMMVKDIYELATKRPNDFESFGNALYKSIYQAIKEKTGGDSLYFPNDVVTVINILFNESERGCALVAASFLDEELGNILKSYFVADKKIVNEIFRHSGPLDTFTARINIAYCLGLISNNARKDLDIIRNIRNIFAHGARKVSFEDSSIKSKCNGLYHDAYKEILPPRHKFVRVVAGVALEIHTTLVQLKRCIKKPDRDFSNGFNQEERKIILDIMDKYRRKYIYNNSNKET